MAPFKHLKAVVFDWAGTVVDHGSLAPMGVFVEVFAEFGVAITVDEARVPMGMAKRPHIAAIMALAARRRSLAESARPRSDRGRHRCGLRGVRPAEPRGGGKVRRRDSRDRGDGPRAPRAMA